MDASFKEERPPHPRANTNIFGFLTFWWIINLFKKGRKKDLEINDLYSTLNEHSASILGSKLEKKWEMEQVNAKKGNREPSLLRALFKMFGYKFVLYGFLIVIVEVLIKLSQPYFVGQIVALFEQDKRLDKSSFLFYGISLMLLKLVYTFGFCSYDIFTKHMGMKIRVSICSLIYKKTLRLSNAVLVDTTVGQIVNLLTNDVNRFDISMFFIHFLWIGPLQTIVATYLLWQEIGLSSIFGVAALVLFIPLQGWLGKKTSEFRSKTTIATDERLRLMNEIITGIQVIKMYTWERPFAYLVESARKIEMHHIKGSSYVRALMLSFYQFQGKISLFVSIFSYVLLGNYITGKKVFVIASYYNMMKIAATLFFPVSMGQIAEMRVTIKRLQDFLLNEEKDYTVSSLPKADEAQVNGIKNLSFIDENVKESIIDINKDTKPINDLGITITNATAKWRASQTNNTLNHINLTVKPGRLVAVIGPVGAGKSSLIQAVLRELPISQGSITVRGVVSYASQESWIFASSVQQNILFGLPMDEERYKKVIQLCALKTDMERLPYGDKTIVGERGISLSGGQKARINLARAIYKEADIYLFDDPLSAVDTHVGKHLFEKCIKEHLKEKVCMFVTHQLQYLTNVDQIVSMANGNILAEGTYQELNDSGFDFSKLLKPADDKTIVTDNECDTLNFSTVSLDRNTVLSRHVSKQSIMSSFENSINEEAPKPKEIEETRSSGNIAWSVYSSYFSAGGNSLKMFLFVFICIFSQMLTSGGEYWITVWVNLEEHIYSKVIDGAMNDTLTMAEDTSVEYPLSRQTCVIVFAVLIVSMVVVICMRSAIIVSVFMKASMILHTKMFNAITRATMYFFNVNSSGRILNRFSKDIGVMDDILLSTIIDCVQIGLTIFGIIILVGVVNVYLMIPTLIMGLLFYRISVFYLSTSRSIKRLEGITRSPLVAHLNASLQGLTTIRAFGAEQILCNEFGIHQDLHSTTWYLFINSSVAFGLWLDLICLVYMFVVTFSFLIIENTNVGNVGLAITQSIGIVGLTQWGFRQFTELENQITSVERVLEYINAPQEPALDSPADRTPANEWPSKGEIMFKNYSLRYSSDSPNVLENINVYIESMEKVGIVGRTGAGKSSLITALFRMALNEGSICIDGIEIHELGLRDLRSKISIIPQEPFLFSGTLRKNLDPFDNHPDHVLWNALDEVELKGVVESLPDGLNSKMSEGGSNFSVGQRQLLCLARATLQNNKILIMDEATANVDQQTDALIQNTIRNKFRTCTVLTIAHRLNTIMDSDKVLVMNAGKIVEFDHPFNLLKTNDGIFCKMVEQTGQNTADLLHKIAAENFETMQSKNNLMKS